jgi:tetratricopeptide (TPR) repeat protein
MTLRAGARAATLAALVVAMALPARANPESDALRAKASYDVYNLDRDEAIAGFRRAVTVDPQDAAAYRGLASSLWISITFRRGSMTVDDYLGRAVTKPSGSEPAPPPAEVATAFREALERANAIARSRLAKNPKDPDAHYQLGAAEGLRASYVATVERSAMGAFKAAREAYDEHEQVLTLDPRRKDAGLIVGTYRYLVSAMSMPIRWMAYVVGFGGGKERGLKMIEEAAAYGGENQDDARFALVLIYNREKRYDDALRVLATLRERFPKNRLAWLETGATYLRAGRAADAERFLNDGLARSANDTRTRMFGEEALWYYKRGAARVALGRASEADSDLRRALKSEGRKWVHGRTHTELGKLAIKAGKPASAREEFQAAITMCEGDNDPFAAEEARRLMNTVR